MLDWSNVRCAIKRWEAVMREMLLSPFGAVRAKYPPALIFAFSVFFHQLVVVAGSASAQDSLHPYAAEAPGVPSRPARVDPPPVAPRANDVCTDPTQFDPRHPGRCPEGMVNVCAYAACPAGVINHPCGSPPPDENLSFDIDTRDHAANICAQYRWVPRCRVGTMQFESYGDGFDTEVFDVHAATYAISGSPQCSQDLVRSAQAFAAPMEFSEWARYADDAMRRWLLETLRVSITLGSLSNSVVCTNPTAFNHWAGTCGGGNIYLVERGDGSCNAIDAATVNGLCNGQSETWLVNLVFSSSPISLEWESQVPVESISSMVQFPISPASTGKWQLWRGSAQSPLLVYDPGHRGTVTSGEQLFGNWTFGGQRLASASSLAAAPQPWRDGYDALATLDTNRDGVLTGAELAPLALWFDENQNGVSEPGEVKNISETGVETLRLGAKRSDPIRGSVSVDQGFTRRVNGALRTGRTVDWFTKESAVPSEIFRDWQMRSQSAPPALDHTANESQAAAEPPARNTRGPAGITGVWRFTITGGAAKNPAPESGGLLVLQQGLDGDLAGISLVETSITNPGLPDKYRMIHYLALRGTVDQEPDEKPELRFSLAAATGRATNSHATLVSSGVLEGQTTEVTAEGEGRPIRFTYNWRATKLAKPDVRPSVSERR